MSNNIPMRYWPYEAEAATIIADLESLRLKMLNAGNKLVEDECPSPANRYFACERNIRHAQTAMEK